MHRFNCKSFFVLGLIIFSAMSSIAQERCAKGDLVGEWKEVASLRGRWNNVDSIKIAAVVSKRSLGIWEFKDDNTYRYRHPLQRSRYKRNSVFKLDGNTCQLVLGRRKDAHESRNLEIIYLTTDHLIYHSDNNPKGYYTHVLVRNQERNKD
jgi:hypothetical protein